MIFDDLFRLLQREINIQNRKKNCSKKYMYKLPTGINSIHVGI